MYKKNSLFNQKGFTLMEVIIVIAIIAILATVAVPSVTGYVEEAKESADLQKSAEIMTAVVFAYNLNADIIPEGKLLIVRWDTNASLGSGDGSVVAELRTYGNIHTSSDQAWISTFNVELQKLLGEDFKTNAVSKYGQSADLLLKYDPATGEFEVHSTYKTVWIDEIGLDLGHSFFG